MLIRIMTVCIAGVVLLSFAGTQASAAPRRETLSGGLIAFQGSRGIGVIDPSSGRRRILVPVPGNGLPISPSRRGQRPRPFIVDGPVWGPTPGSPLPSLYFSVHDGRALRFPDQIPYDWLFRADPFTGSLQPIAARMDVTGEGPEGLAAFRSGVAFTLGCCQNFAVDFMRLSAHGQPTYPRSYSLANNMLFLLGASPSGRLVVYDTVLSGPPNRPDPTKLLWLDPVNGHMSPFALPTAMRGSNAGLVSFAPGRRKAAIALYRGRIAVIGLGSPTRGRLLYTQFARRISGLAWSPDGDRLAVATAGRLYLLRPANRGSDGKALLAAHGTRGIAWSSALPRVSMGALRTMPSAIPFLNGLLAATRLPGGITGTYVHGRAAVGVRVYPFNVHGRHSARLAAATHPLPPSFPSLRAWANGRSWSTGSWLLGGKHRYRVIITGHDYSAAYTLDLGMLGHRRVLKR